ncbi:10 kDa heat shock protein-like protein, mitochondrial [Tribonema minus]|uniref:10 kDa heat shock protein-like protein, mitochondrial n=1 Tax=Tribonema minus TaxID=303371 RepID=A0A836C8A7_9STRA|nr:10 kDa heat shock protein-like protein, mitochondrial [Tribonema minus]
MSGLRKLIPLADRILVKRIVPKAQTAGGVFLPETKMAKLNEAEVIAVGPGRRTEDGKVVPMSISVGDTVLLPEYGGHTVSLSGEDVTLLREEEILGKFSS